MGARQGSGARHQRGAALIISLILLSVALILGVSAMQSALLDERMAGNHRFATQAQMAAEGATAELAGWLGERPTRAWGDDLGLQLDASFDAWPACGGDIRQGVRVPVADNAWAWLLACREDGERVMQVQGEAGSPGSTAARYPGRVPLVLAGYAGIATASFIGGVASDAEIQWPSSEASRLSGEDQAGLHDAIPAVLVEHRAGDETYSASALHATVDNEAKVLEGRIVENEPSAQSLGLLRAIYEACYDDNGGRQSGDAAQRCEHVWVVPPGGASNQERRPPRNSVACSNPGNRCFNGLWVDLSGALDIRGNATVHGAAIVANITIDESGVWRSAPNDTIKLAGGGNSGSVWFDSVRVADAIDELRLKHFSAFAELSLENFFGQSAGGGLRLDGWLR
ncbi:pilus assembly PilX family protein [Halomonas sp. 328]|uniref:pilus assembly PilX family protein n=1 Tax=Halomonas sp. 328 TaxID=2776704 RepID=UPI0018A74A1D|nr:PilX N-terminal domain-containing pilus assembly protein [Halomonas sp. 328]MBF8224010.1 hypothetical protein [Halomonas sp. 328]